MFLGLSVPLSLVFIAGINVPLIYSGTDLDNLLTFLNLGVTGLSLTWIFTALAFYFSTKFEDKIKGLGIAVLLWLFFIILYDGIVIIILFLFSDYPIDNFAVFLNLLNPVSLGRIYILLQLDISALMGYTGAVFSRFFGSQVGILISILAMIFWIIIPLIFGQRKFLKKDF
jgi:Cu-processing system permease protein